MKRSKASDIIFYTDAASLVEDFKRKTMESTLSSFILKLLLLTQLSFGAELQEDAEGKVGPQVDNVTSNISPMLSPSCAVILIFGLIFNSSLIRHTRYYIKSGLLVIDFTDADHL